MRVITKWPALVPAIQRAGHEPVLLDSDGEVADDRPSPYQDPHFMPYEYGRGAREQDMPEPSVTARPRGAQRYPR